MYQVRVLDAHGVVESYVFDLSRREAVRLYWKLEGCRVQLLANRRVIAERSE